MSHLVNNLKISLQELHKENKRKEEKINELKKN